MLSMPMWRVPISPIRSHPENISWRHLMLTIKDLHILFVILSYSFIYKQYGYGYG